jgi:hypothetical protein
MLAGAPSIKTGTAIPAAKLTVFAYDLPQPFLLCSITRTDRSYSAKTSYTAHNDTSITTSLRNRIDGQHCDRSLRRPRGSGTWNVAVLYDGMGL